MEFLFVLVLIGLIPAAIAKSKGHSFVGFWVYGALLFIIALPHALIMKPNSLQQRGIIMKKFLMVVGLVGMLVTTTTANTPVTDSNMIYSAWVSSNEFLASEMPDSGFICWSSFSPFSDYTGNNAVGRAGFKLDLLGNGNYMTRGYALKDETVNGFFAYWCEMTYDDSWNLVELTGVMAGAYIGGNRDYCDCNPDRGYVSDTSSTILVPGWYAKIQPAIDCATNGDTVLVAPGVYTGLGNKNIEFRGKSVICKSEFGPIVTIIDAENNGRAFFIHEGEDSTTVIEGFTIRNGRTGGMSHGGGINASGASPTIRYNIIYDCYAGRGGGILCENNTAPIIINNTVMYNQGGGIQAVAGTISNNISRENSWFNFTIGGGIYPSSYNNFGGSFIGEGNMDLDPIFLDPINRDFRLQPTSPCIDAGNPNPQYNDPDGSRNDMGALPFSVVGCDSGCMSMDPDMLYSLYYFAITPMTGHIYVGGQEAGEVNQINQSSLLINGTVAPTNVQVVTDVGGFTGDVLDISYSITSFLDDYMPAWESMDEPYNVSGEFNNGTPFEHTSTFWLRGHISGDLNQDGEINVNDLTKLVSYLFVGGEAPSFLPVADTDGNCEVNVSDLMKLVGSLFKGGAELESCHD